MNTICTQAGWRVLAFTAAFLGISFAAHAVVVTFPDPVLESLVRDAINKPTGDILDSDLLGVAALGTPGDGYYSLENLSGIEYCVNLAYLALEENQITDLSPLAGLTRLTALDLGPLTIIVNKGQGGPDIANKQALDLSPLAGLTKLEYLLLGSKAIADVTPLAGLNSLKTLILSDNQIAQVEPLAGLSNLTWLSLEENQITDVSPLADLSALTWLNLNKNQIVDVRGLDGATSLTTLALNSNQIVDVGPLASLTGLDTLYLWGNQIVDVSALLRNAGLGAHDYITLNDNPLSARACTDISILESRGVQVSHDPCVGIGFMFYVTPHSGQHVQGHPLSMKVAFVGEEGTAQIQWSKNGVDIPGAISDTLTIDSLTVDDTAAYRVRVTDDSKEEHVTSPATITVTEASSLPLTTLPIAFSSSAGIILAAVVVLCRTRKRVAVELHE